MHMRDLSDLPGVAKARSAAHTDDISRARGQDNAAAAMGFANPAQNVVSIGVQSGSKVADFGSGSGAYSVALAHAVGAGGRVYAIDVQKDLLTRIKNQASQQHLDNIEIIWGDFEKNKGTRIADKQVDLVLISNTLFQLEDKSGALHEARRILKDGGRLALIDWSDSFNGMGPQKTDVVTKEAAQDLARMAGFQLLNEFRAGAHHYGLLFKTAAQ